MDELLYLLSVSIQNEELDTLQKLIQSVPLGSISASDSYKLLNYLLVQCMNHNRFPSAKILLEEWNSSYPELENLELFTTLFMDEQIDLDVLKFLSSNSDKTFFETAEDLSRIDLGDRTHVACQRLSDSYPVKSYDTMKTLMEYLDRIDNGTMYNYFQHVLRELSPSQEKPKWIIEGTSTLPEIRLPKFENDVDVLIEYVKEDLERDKGRVDEKKIRKAISEMDEIERKEKVYEPHIAILLLQLQEDENLFRILGPSNPPSNPTVDQLEYGGSRMFIGKEWDFDEDTQEFDDWFIGACEQCNLKIDKRNYALRLPKYSGGWTGCYCSFHCLRQRLSVLECRKGEMDLLTRTLIEVLEEKLNSIGIYEGADEVLKLKFNY